jgi:IS1 family transposase
VQNPTNRPVSEETKKLIDKLLLERLAIAAISRVSGISETWIQGYVNGKCRTVEKKAVVSVKKKGSITIQCDEMWSYVGKKKVKKWIWLAMDVETREIVGAYIGSRSSKGANCLWLSLPSVYRQCAVAYTDFWQAYAEIFPSKRHKAVGKETGKTNYIERFNCTMRQRVARLVRETLSFSKKLENHVGAIWIFIHHYNAEIQARLSLSASLHL